MKFDFKKEWEAKLNHLLAALVGLMEKVGGESVQIDYNGCGDSGCADFENLLDAKGEVIDEALYGHLEASVEEKHGTWNDKKKSWDYRTSLVNKTLPRIAEEIAYEMLTLHAGGWEINAGSAGFVKIQRTPLSVQLNHTPSEDEEDEDGNTVEVEQEEEVYEYTPSLPTVRAPKKATKKAAPKKAAKKVAVKKAAKKVAKKRSSK